MFSLARRVAAWRHRRRLRKALHHPDSNVLLMHKDREQWW